MPKKTEFQNTLLVNGKGQIGEGSGYTQPVKDTDMRKLSYLTSWKYDQKSGIIIAEGEAGNAYPDLKHFRRSTLWMPGQYLLLLDDISANGAQEIAWTANACGAAITDAGTGQGYFAGEAGLQIPYQLLSNQNMTGNISELVLLSGKGNVKVQKTSFSANTDKVRIACVINAWQDQSLRTTFTDNGSDCTIIVSGNNFTDTWTWKPAADLTTPASFNCKRDNKVIASLSSTDKAAHGDGQH
jgi:hypothetical protein